MEMADAKDDENNAWPLKWNKFNTWPIGNSSTTLGKMLSKFRYSLDKIMFCITVDLGAAEKLLPFSTYDGGRKERVLALKNQLLTNWRTWWL